MTIMFWLSLGTVFWGMAVIAAAKPVARFAKTMQQRLGEQPAASIINPAFVRTLGCLFIVGGALGMWDALQNGAF